MRPRLVGINHVALQVDDLEEAVAFYTALFEPTAIDRSEHDAAFLEIGDQFIALFGRGSRRPASRSSLGIGSTSSTRAGTASRSCSTTRSSSRRLLASSRGWI